MVAVVVLILVLVFAPRLAHTEWAGVRSQGEVVAAQGWAETQWGKLNAAIEGAVNRYYLRRYDRRAPLEPTPAASATPKVARRGSRRRRPRPAAENPPPIRKDDDVKARFRGILELK